MYIYSRILVVTLLFHLSKATAQVVESSSIRCLVRERLVLNYVSSWPRFIYINININNINLHLPLHTYKFLSEYYVIELHTFTQK